MKERLQKIEKWFIEMQAAAQGPVDNEIVFLEKTKANDLLDLEFYNYERKVIILLFNKLA
jgi:hypothetical protein